MRFTRRGRIILEGEVFLYMSYKAYKKLLLFIFAFVLISLIACNRDEVRDALTEPDQNTTESIPVPEQDESESTDQITFTPTGASGYDSPEEAVTAFLGALRNADLNHMIDTFFVGYNNEDLITTLAVEIQRGDIAVSISEYYTVLSVFNSRADIEALDFQSPMFEGAANEFYLQLSEIIESPKLSTLDVLGFIQLEDLSQLGYAFGLSYDFIVLMTA